MTQRSLALDAMRGVTLALMILVNTPGSWSYIYPPLRHAAWHGVTPTDFVFPFFLFIVGCALFYSQRKQALLPLSQRAFKIVRRALLLFLIGLGLNALWHTGTAAEFRIPGVLQRIALAYAMAAFIVWLPLVPRWCLAATVLAAYPLVFLIAGSDYSLTDNPVLALDLALLGAGHLWHGTGVAFDPEGLLSTLPAVVTVLSGYEVTRYHMTSGDRRWRSPVVLASVAAIAVALLLHPWIPINKSLWTSSFVLLTSGVAALVLSLAMRLEGVASLQLGYRAFAVYGENPLFLYVLAGIWVKALVAFPPSGMSLYAGLYGVLCRVFTPVNASLVFALWHVLLFWAMAYWLHRRRIVISL